MPKRCFDGAEIIASMGIGVKYLSSYLEQNIPTYYSFLNDVSVKLMLFSGLNVNSNQCLQDSLYVWFAKILQQPETTNVLLNSSLSNQNKVYVIKTRKSKDQVCGKRE